MNPENEKQPIEPALNGDEPSSSAEDVTVEPNGHESLEQPTPEEPQAEEPQAEEPQAEEPQAEEPQAEEPQAEEPQAEESRAEQPPAAEEVAAAEKSVEAIPESPPEAEVVATAAAEEPAPPSEAPAQEPSSSEVPAAADGAVAEDEEGDATSIAADIQKMLAKASASARASAEAAERAAADADVEIAVALAEPEEAEPPADSEEGEEGEESAAVARIFQPGDWFVVHTYAGYENKVKANLQSRISSMNMEEKIFEVTIPMEDVMEIKSGKKQVVQRKVFPGYLLVRMDLDDDSWYVVRNTPGVTGFVGSGTKPIPLSEREVDRILQRKAVGERPKPKLEWSLNDPVRVTTGPFANFQGLISEIDTDRSKLKVLVNIFGRETPVELGFDQVAKV
jgi:transcriptional antiterminator NusG